MKERTRRETTRDAAKKSIKEMVRDGDKDEVEFQSENACAGQVNATKRK